MGKASEPTVCACVTCCECYYADRRVVRQWQEFDSDKIEVEDGLIVAGVTCCVEYETGEVQRLIRPWMDLWPQEQQVAE